MSVVALFVKPSPGELEPAETLTLISGKGIDGDVFYGATTRQVLAISANSLARANYKPGDLREHIVVDLPALQELESGTRLFVGPVEFTVEMPCEPCLGMAQRLGEDGKEFVKKMLHDRGMFLLTEGSGTIQIGDPVKVIDG